MDNVVQFLVAVVDGDVSGQCAGLDEVPFRFGQSVFPAILLQYDQVAAHFGSGIGEKVAGQADSRNQSGVVHQPFPYGTVAGRVHDSRSRDESHYAAFPQRIHAFQKEIVVYGVECPFAYRIATAVKVTVIYSGISERDIGGYHIEITVIIRLYGLEAVYNDLAVRIERGENPSGELVLLKAGYFRHVLQRADENSGTCGRVKKTSGDDTRCLQRPLYDGCHRFGGIECGKYGIFKALYILLVLLLVRGILPKQFMQQPHLREQFPVSRSLSDVRVFFCRIEDTFQSSETGVAVQYFAPFFGETKLRAHEQVFKCGHVVRQMLSLVICHIVLYLIG